MSGSKASSSSSTSSSTTQVDDRVTAADQAVAVGGNGQLIVTDEFNDNVKDAFLRVVELVENAGIVATGFAEKSIGATEKALQAVAERATISESRENANAVTVTRLAMFAGIAGVAFIVLNSKTDFSKIFKGK
jgi:adenine-specific DNA methylase